MEIATILHTHGDTDVTLDTLDSIKFYMTNKVLLLVDAAGWDHYANLDVPADKMKGFYHGYYKAPYRNVILGLLTAAQRWPTSDWFCYMEYDCLVGSSAMKKDLAVAEKTGVWAIGNDFRDKQTVQFPLVELMLKSKFKEIVYLLGCCMFFHKDFIKKAMAENFFERFLYYTNDFRNGFFPGYTGPAAWDLTEHLLPTLAKHWGGEVKQFARWSQKARTWSGGNYFRYPMRWQPSLFFVDHEYLTASVLHPSKTCLHDVRIYHRKKREALREQNGKRI